MATTPTDPPRVVLDTNIVLSALVFGGGTPGDTRRAWQAHRLRPLISKTTAAELLRVLAYPKFKLDPQQREQLLADYLPHCTTVQIPPAMTGIPRCRDPYDQPFLELAAAGDADFLATGDQDLLVLAPQFRCKIVTAAELLALLPT